MIQKYGRKFASRAEVRRYESQLLGEHYETPDPVQARLKEEPVCSDTALLVDAMFDAAKAFLHPTHHDWLRAANCRDAALALRTLLARVAELERQLEAALKAHGTEVRLSDEAEQELDTARQQLEAAQERIAALIKALKHARQAILNEASAQGAPPDFGLIDRALAAPQREEGKT